MKYIKLKFKEFVNACRIVQSATVSADLHIPSLFRSSHINAISGVVSNP